MEDTEASQLQTNSVGAPPLVGKDGGSEDPVVVEPQHSQTGRRVDVKSLLSQAQGKCISENRELYQAVMRMFNELENELKVQADEKITVDSMKSFSSKKNLEAVFARDFPFHLVLAHRISSHSDIYRPDVFTKYVTGCCDRLRTLKKEIIAATLLAFHSRGDFSVEYGPAKKSVFLLLQDASIALARKLPIMEPRKQQQLNVFSTIALISISHKCHSKRRAASKVSANWQMCLVEKFQVKLTPAMISELQEGLALGKLLELPRDIAFCPEWLGSQLMSHSNVQLISVLTNLVTAIEPYISLQEQFLAHFLNLPRGTYSLALDEEKLKDVCLDGTRTSVIKESLHYLDVVHRIVDQRGWLDSHFSAHCQKWLDLLIQLIDITDDGAEELLNEILNPNVTVAKKFKDYIKNQLNMCTRQHLVKLPEDKFLSIFKTFDFWKTADVEAYLDHNKASTEIDLMKPVWSDMFYFAQLRADGGDDVSFFLGFFETVAEQYRSQKKSMHFVLDLCRLKSPTPLLFPDESVRMASSQTSKAAPGDFTTFLHRYIQKNSLCSTLLDHVEDIWKLCSNERNEFQEYVLEIVTKELFSDISVIKGTLQESVSLLISRAIATVCSMPLFDRPQSAMPKFSWCIIATCCERIPAEKENLHWVSEYSAVTKQLGQVLQPTARLKAIDGTSSAEQSVSTLAVSDHARYFQWVNKVKDIFLFWKKKFSSHNIMHQEIEMYHEHREEIYKLAEVFQDRSLAVSDSDVASLKMLFLQQFEKLNMILIKYIPGSTDGKWCSLMTLLSNNGVTLPHKLQTATSQCVAFPATDNYSSDQFKFLAPAISAHFKPGVDVSLKLCKATNLKQLESIVRSLGHFTEPLCNHMEMLVFFSLKDCQLFARLLHYYLLTETSDDRQYHSSFKEGSFAFDVAAPGLTTELEDTPTAEMILLQQALRSTRNLLAKLGDGKATYREVTANGALDLRVVKIDHEVDAITEFLEQSYTDIPASYTQVQGLLGPNWLKSLLELLEIRKHIIDIHNVAHKFSITGCLTDENLKQLVFMAKELESDLSVADLTLETANDKMGIVKEQLCITKESDYEFLNLFPVLAESVPFHDFLYSQNFSGFEGQERFKQEIELITGHLQHADYNEIVLNHLILAYEYMVPFLDHDQNIRSLMLKVFSQHLVPENGRKILDTVNRNIDLIKLWFSRAKIGIAENVLRELACVLTNGQYRFVLQSTSDAVQCELELNFRLTPEPPARRATGTIVILDPEDDNSSTRVEDGDISTKGTLIVWNADEITNFVRKLGFLGAKKVKGNDIMQFQNLYEVALRLSDLHVRLKKLGHRDYLPSKVTKFLPCSLSADEASQEESTTKQLLEVCLGTVSKLHKKYEWLMFFSVAKVIVLQEMLISEEPKVESIVEEIGPLLVNTPSAREALTTAVKKVITERKYQYVDQNAMDVVGKALDEVFADSAVEEHSIKKHTAKGPESSKPGCCWGVTEMQSSIVLHHCPKDSTFSQKHLVMLVISLYQGAPEAFQIFHCQSSTTREELEFFFKRVTKHPLAYFVIEINHLPLHLQEDFIQMYQEYMTDESAKLATLHLVESAPSALREIAWIPKQEHKDANLKIGKEDVSAMLKKRVLKQDNLSCVQLVYGSAGCGKSHQIHLEVEGKCPHFVEIAVNEAFCIQDAIMKLRTLPKVEHCAIIFNFTMTSPHVIVGKKGKGQQSLEATTEQTEYTADSFDVAMQELYNQRIEGVRWFFFSLLILGYVEEANCGMSFQFPTGLSWRIYVEVPSYDTADPRTNLEQFIFDVPVLGIVGIHHFVHTGNPFTVDSDVRLVCQYLQAFKKRGQEVFDPGSEPVPTDEECGKLLEEFIPDTIRGITPDLKVKENKTAQRLFLKYLKRRCAIINAVPHGRCKFLRKQGDEEEVEEDLSSVFKIMLDEVRDICQWSVRKKNEERWRPKLVKQLICGKRDGIPTFQLFELDEDDYMKHLSDGEFQDGLFHSYLSHALNIPLSDGRLTPIDDAEYVLTLDYTIKMLQIHERSECGVPVIIEGETGVGKTALIEMLSKLWNYGVLTQWKSKRSRLVELLKQKLGAEVANGILDSMDTMKEKLLGILNNDVGEGTSEESREIQRALTDFVLALKQEPISFFLSIVDGKTRELLWDIDSPKALVDVLYRLLMAEPQNAFYKLNVHSALQPNNIMEFFKPIFEQASSLQSVFQVQETEHKVPRVTVFLDEVNTSSCLGLLKEIIVDKTINGNAIPNNVFIVAACNPPREDNLAILDDQTSISASIQETMFRGSYCVQKLPPTLHFLIWDYKALDDTQEREYIRAKVSQLTKFQPGPTQSITDKVDRLTHLIVISHSLMRDYALAYFVDDCGLSETQALIRSQSYVSQRDIQRVFVFYRWLMQMYNELKPHGETEYSLRAMLVSLALVYYLRLNDTYRAQYLKYLDSAKRDKDEPEVKFSQALNDELEWYVNHMELPGGIAKTQALKENCFAIIVCAMTRTPLIIVGPPGCSKTLSFHLVLVNLKGEGSKVEAFRSKMFLSLDPHIYQCCRRTTSTEIDTVFKQAINRQHELRELPTRCVVFMDEAGLPEERHESLKVLHQYLDEKAVSFISITNQPLDAAKSNRAVTVFRPETSDQELVTLTRGCFASKEDSLPPELQKTNLEKITHFCSAYSCLMRRGELQNFFGLRDFIHFIRYLYRKRTLGLSPNIFMQALERNFNGTPEFESVCQEFLKQVDIPLEEVNFRNILDVLKDSLEDRPLSYTVQNEVRYKIIIDPSEDSSLVRFLFSFGVLDRANTRTLCCSGFLGNSRADKVNAIRAILLSVSEGHTVLLYQTDEIHESFYNLFNQNFRAIDDPEKGTRYFANVAIGPYTKPCLVHPNFQCVVVINQSELLRMPPPFLNRFEKYVISHRNLTESRLMDLPPLVQGILQTACEKVVSFLDIVHHSSSIYGLQRESLDSLILMLLPPCDHKFEPFTTPCELVSTKPDDSKLVLLETLQDALKKKGGFNIPPSAPEELEVDAHSVFDIVTTDAKFAGCLGSLNHNNIQRAVTEAVNALYFIPPSRASNKQIPVSLTAALVMMVLQQWLVRHLCKSLMLLMTPEALAVYQNRIPSSYRINYLQHQDHFSLKNCIKKCFENRHKGNGNKLLCYSRSSGFIFGLPSVYPGSKSSHSSVNDKYIESFIFDSPDQVTVFKLQTTHSQSAVSIALGKFIESEDQKIMVIPVNMKELSRQIVNELRIMIEEAENIHAAHDKFFVILLHFPPAMFTDACYPSLFLQGWVHYYFDTIATDTSLGNVDIKTWFQQCTESQVDSPSTLSAALPTMLKTAIPVLASRLSFGSLKNCSFNRPMTLPERTLALESILLGKPLGDVLQNRFLSYWDQATMAKYLRRAATFTRNGESTLNLTECLQEMVKSSFLDFLLYILTRINQNYNLDILFDSAQEQEMHDLFIAIVEVLPLPDILDLNVAYNAMKKEQFTISQDIIPKFPFFTLVSEQVEKVLDQSQHDVNQELDVLAESSASVRNQERVIKLLQEAMMKKLAHSTDKYIHCFKRAMQAIERSDDLWEKYFIDFTHQKLNMRYYEDGISHPLMKAVLDTYVQQSADRVIALHVYFQVHELELAKVAILLRSLNQITQLVSTVPLPASTSMQSFSAGYIKAAEASKTVVGRQDDLTIFITSTLFAAIVGICTTKENERVPEGLLLWYHTYCGVMSLPAVKKFIYQYSRKCGSPEVEGRLNIMYAAYAVIHLNSSVDELLKAQTLFNSLLRAHFSLEDLKLKVACPPRLKEVANITLAVMTGSVDFRDPQYSSEISSLLELLFTHFFSEYFSQWQRDDIQWFLEFANEQKHWKLPITVQDSQPGIPMATFIFFLSRLLLRRKLPNASIHPTRNYEPEVVNEVGKVAESGCTGTPGPYIPTFYQKLDDTLQACANENELMHQPLSHLYFNTVLEHLLCGEFTLSELCEIIDKLGQQCRNPDNDNGKRLLCSIEKQAVIQLLLKRMAEHMDAQSPQKIAHLSGATSALNRVVSNEKKLGGVAHRHGIILALHLLRHSHSFSKFTHILTTEYNDICQDLKYLKYFKKPMTPVHHMDTHLLPFMVSSEGENAKLHQLYQEVHLAMRKAHNTRGKKIDQIQQLAEQCAGDEQRKRDFQMILWLCTYYDFFEKKKSSPDLSRKLSTIVGLEEQPLIMVQCMLDPKLMQKSVHRPDPIWELFCQEHDPSLKQLCNALVNMIAVVLGSPKKASHLWYLLFSPKAVTASYIPGFMHDATLETGSGVFYNNGIHLSTSGVFSRDDCMKYATRGVLTLHSLYVVLWANFGALCMAMLLLPNSEEAIKGILIASDVPIRQYCLSQLTALWKHISHNLGISHEDRSYLVSRCMRNFYALNSEYLSGDSKDCCATPSSLEYQDIHESRWQKAIFQPAWTDMQEKHQELLQHQTLKDLRAMDSCYPYSPSIQEFVHNVLALPNLSTYGLVAHFILQQPLLQADRILLPVLVELYQWLHIDLAYLVTEEKAAKMTFGSAIAEASKHYYSAAGRKDLNALYQQLKECFKKYNETMDVEVPPMPNKSRHMFVITDETPLIELLSSAKVPGRLYSMIASIIKCHNDTIDMLSEVTRIQHHAKLVKHLTSDESSIHPTECKEHTAIMDSSAIFDRNSRFQQLIRRRYQHCTSSSSVLPFYCGSGSILEVPKVPKFDLLKIQEDIAAEYVFGKPRIRDPSTLLKHFCFRKVTSALSEQAFNQDPANLAQDLANIDEHLHPDFKEELNEEEISQMEFSFHSLTYHLLQEVATGLTTAADLLTKAVNARQDPKGLLSQNLAQLLVTEYNDKPGNPLVLHNIGIKSLSQSQMKQLMVVGLPLLFDTLRCFVHWIQVGWYDFHSLPVTMKLHIDRKDVESLRKACKQYKGPIPDLIRELNALMVTLTHTENHFSKLIVKDLDAPIKLYLKERHSISEWENLPALIPDTIKVKHYVNFRIELRRLLDEAHKQVSTSEVQDIEWDEAVPGLLQSHLHNIPVEIVQQNEHFGPQYHKKSLSPELVSDTNQASASMETEGTDVKKTLPGESIETDLTELAMSYTPQKIEEFLNELGMQDYAESFLANEISGDTLMECDSDDEDLIDTLSGLGVQDALHCFKILAGFKKKLTEEAGCPPKYSTQKIQGRDPLADFLKKYKMPPKYQEHFIAKDFDWELLLYVDDSPKNVLVKALPKALEEIGITSGLHKTLFKKSFKSFIRENFS